MSEPVERNDRALFLSPLAAPFVVLLARMAFGATATKVAFPNVAFWAVLEAGSYAGIWLVLGWGLAWAAWKVHLARHIRRSAIGVAIVLLLATLVLSLFGRALSSSVELTVSIGALLNLAVFLWFERVSLEPVAQVFSRATLLK